MNLSGLVPSQRLTLEEIPPCESLGSSSISKINNNDMREGGGGAGPLSKIPKDILSRVRL